MDEVLEELYSLTRFGTKLGLENITRVLGVLNNPQNTYPSVHVAGTNGKGSVCAFLSNCLKEAGYKVGVYTSPHLVKFNERIKVNNQEISDADLVALVKKVKQAALRTETQLTFFEFTTVVAFLYFQKESVDIAIIEVGLGGRLDATNVITPIISVITPISIDHQEHLGDSLKQITKEKAGIIKEKVPVVISNQTGEVLDVLRQVCREKHCELYQASAALGFVLGLGGEHQKENAGVVLTVLKVISKQFPVSSRELRQGLATATWPGRLHYIVENILLDGAHNIQGITSLMRYLDNTPKDNIFVVGMKKGKEWQGMLRVLAANAKIMILTESSFQPIPAEELEKEAKNHCGDTVVIKNPQDALQEAKRRASQQDRIIVTGSLYLVGDVLKSLKTDQP